MSKNRYFKPKLTNVVGIILAAGSSKRMGCTKQLLSCGDQSLIEKVICTAESSKLSRVIVVLGYDLNKILKQVKFTRSVIVPNLNFKHGQSSSIYAGLIEASKTYCDAIIFILGDQPLITSKIINKLIEFPFIRKKSIVIPTYCGKRGNPIVFNKHFFSELMSLTGDIGGRELIKRHKDCVIEVELNSNAILFDLDTREDYYKLNNEKHR